MTVIMSASTAVFASKVFAIDQKDIMGNSAKSNLKIRLIMLHFLMMILTQVLLKIKREDEEMVLII